MKRQLFLALITFVAIAGVNFDAIAQETKFDVVEGGKSLGEIILLKKVEGIKTTFSYNSKIDYNLQGMILKTEESLVSTNPKPQATSATSFLFFIKEIKNQQLMYTNKNKISVK